MWVSRTPFQLSIATDLPSDAAVNAQTQLNRAGLGCVTRGQFRLPSHPGALRVSTVEWQETGDMCLFPPRGSIVTLQVSCDASEQILPRSPDWF